MPSKSLKASRLVIHADEGRTRINRHVYGHFAEHLGRCVYEGLWVGPDSPIPNTRGFRNDVVGALRKLNMPNLRWPGGCFADTYHWMDGIGPREKRPSIVNVHWGGVTENNHCGTHEFLDLCTQLGCEPYIAGNLGSGTVREMTDWLEYITQPAQSPMADLRRRNGREDPWQLSLWGVGNENWGCGGNMKADYYANEYRRYACFCRHFTPGKKLYKVACGFDDNWNDILMREAARHMDGLSVHYYTIPGTWEKKGPATGFSDADWYLTLRKASEIDGFILRTKAIMDRHDPEKRVGIVMDEWGTWFDVEPGTNPGFLYQQNTMRDALVAGLTFNIFHAHADRVHVANIAQTINVLQAMALTDGAKMLLTPTYHVFEMFKVHQDATLLPTFLDTPTCGDDDNAKKVPRVSASASRNAAGKLHVSLCNLHADKPAELAIEVRGAEVGGATGRILVGDGPGAMNTFSSPKAVAPESFAKVKAGKGAMTLKLPPHSVLLLELA
jgi:alpha-L-arabinofuranosidase